MATRQEQLDFLRAAVVPAERVAARLGVPSNAVMAQWAMESGWGTSQLSKAANNFGGIKEWKGGPSVNMPTKEEVNGKKVSTTANFKKFTDINQYADEYGNFLSGKRYDKVRGQADPSNFINALANSGYATTNPREYSNSIIGTMKSVDRLLPEIKSSMPAGNRAANQPADASPGFSIKKESVQTGKPISSNAGGGMSPFSENLMSSDSSMAGGSGSSGLDIMGGIAGLLEGFAGAGDSAGSNATNMMLADYANSLNKPTFDYSQPIKYKFPGFFNG
jgi:hypothetical protein